MRRMMEVEAIIGTFWNLIDRLVWILLKVKYPDSVIPTDKNIKTLYTQKTFWNFFVSFIQKTKDIIYGVPTGSI